MRLTQSGNKPEISFFEVSTPSLIFFSPMMFYKAEDLLDALLYLFSLFSINSSVMLISST